MLSELGQTPYPQGQTFLLRIGILILLGTSACTSGGVWVKPSPPQVEPFTPHCLIIPPLENLSLTSKAGLFLGELIAQEIEATTGMEVLSPLGYLSLLSQIKPPSSDPLDPATLLFLRDRLGIEALLVGTITEYWYTDDPEVYGDKQPAIGVIIRLIRADTGVEEFHGVISRTHSSLFGDTFPLTALAQEVAEEVARLLASRFSPMTKSSNGSSPCRFQTLLAPPLQSVSHIPPESTTQLSASPAPSSPKEEGTKATVPTTLTLAEELAQGKTVILKGVKFKKGSKELLQGSHQAILDLVQLLKADPELRVRILVHTDSEGDPQELKKLSEEQAEIFRNLLIQEHGIPSHQIVVEGRGGTENIVPNTNEFLREVNRRVEVVMISSGPESDGKAQGPSR